MPELGPLRPERVAVYTLTLPGLAVAERIHRVLPGSTLYAAAKYRGLLEGAVYFEEPIKELLLKTWPLHDGHVFVMASGIVLRAIAPLILDKRVDPAVLVVDLKGRYFVPLLAGHLGGANPLARHLAEALGGALLFRADVTQDEELDALFAGVKEAFGGLDYLVHAIAFAPREAMEGRYIDTRRQDWLLALEVSAYSLVAVARRAEPLLREGGGIVTLTYYASEKVVPKYNVMAIAKAALEASVRYLAYELGPKGVRVNAISAGPVRTVAARSIPGFTKMYDRVAQTAPLRRNITQEEVGNLGLFLLSPLASGITGEVVYVDAGYHIMGMELEG
jgi:enoyl-[acyl-carrier protein] reductase I